MGVIKKCSACEEFFPLTREFFYYRKETSKRSGHYQGKCIPCERASQQIFRDRPGYKERTNAEKREYRHLQKLRAIDYKGNDCQHCGEQYHAAAFDFHHIDPDQKEMDPGLMMNRSWKVLVKELDKCILLCANCHRIHHYENS